MVYPHRADLANKLFYKCDSCIAWVGCHPDTDNPLGRLANAELRRARFEAHAAFDPMWKGAVTTRTQAYTWLADQLGIPAERCHIGSFDVALCRRVVEICVVHKKTLDHDEASEHCS
jgi:hypothetical protein